MQLSPLKLPGFLTNGSKKGWRGRRKPSSALEGRPYKPGATVPVSGIYNVVDKKGTYLEHQITCHAGKPFPPAPHEEILKKFPERRAELERAGLEAKDLYRYELAFRAIHLSSGEGPPAYPVRIHRPGEPVPTSGIYNVVDEESRYLLYQRALVEGKDAFPPIRQPMGYGYMLAHTARHLHMDAP